MDGKLSLPLGESYVSHTCIPHAVSLQIVTLAGSLQNAMAACEASQISYTSTKKHVFVLCCSRQIMLLWMNSWKSLNCYIVCIN